MTCPRLHSESVTKTQSFIFSLVLVPSDQLLLYFFFSCNMYVSAHVYRHTQIKWPLSGQSHIPSVNPGLRAVLNTLATASSHPLSAGKIYEMKINQ